MHEFDPNGALHEYRKERDRRELRHTITFAIVSFFAGLMILAGVDITLSLFGR